MKPCKPIGLFFSATAFGFLLSQFLWDGMVYFYPASNKRHPAAVHKSYDLSDYQGHDLRMASKKRLLSEALIREDNGRFGIELGHFVTKGSSGQKQYACDAYDIVEMTFTSGDQAVNGQLPTMVVEGRCRVGLDTIRMEPIWIPMDKVLSERAGDIELHYPELSNLAIKFTNVGDNWPHVWNLSQVRLKSRDIIGKSLAINQKEIRDLLPYPLSVNWKDPKDLSKQFATDSP